MSDPLFSPRLIPTHHKTKMPRGWSHPVGAELISKALLGLPEYDSIYLRFLWSSQYKVETKEGLLSISYESPDQTAMEQNWRIDVFAVRSEHKLLLRQRIVEEVLPRAREWMTRPRTPAWYQEWKSLDASYNWDTENIEYRESGRT